MALQVYGEHAPVRKTTTRARGLFNEFTEGEVLVSLSKPRLSLVRRGSIRPSRPPPSKTAGNSSVKTPSPGNSYHHGIDHGHDHEDGLNRREHLPRRRRAKFTKDDVDGSSRRVRHLWRTVLAYSQVALAGLSADGRRITAVSMVLTWRYADGYRPSHIAQVVDRYTKWLERRSIPYAYLWVLETQARGAPHLHLVFFVPHRVQLPWPTRIPRGGRVVPWSHGEGWFERARSIPAIVGYVCKAATKYELPRGARVFRVGGVNRQWKQVARWHALPAWLRARTVQGEPLTRAPGGGYASRVTGEIHRSPWRCAWVGGGEDRELRFELIPLDYGELRAQSARAHIWATELSPLMTPILSHKSSTASPTTSLKDRNARH
jgi:hypothetical protein